MSNGEVYPDVLSCIYERTKMCSAMTRVQVELEKGGRGSETRTLCLHIRSFYEVRKPQREHRNTVR